jgi:hypothetical protein
VKLVSSHSPNSTSTTIASPPHNIRYENNSVQLDNLPFVKRGRADQWLTSEVFGLTEPRSKDAEQAMERAKQLQLMEHPPKDEVQQISERLKEVLAPDDEFWPLWVYFAEQQGVDLDSY